MRMILCAEQELALISLRRLFEGRGHEMVATAHRPGELPDLVERHHPDLCVLDVVYHSGSRTEDPAGSIAQCSRLTDVVVITDDDQVAEGATALASGASAVISKSTSGKELVDQVVRRTPQKRPTRTRSANTFFLTEREHQVLESLADGESTERIAARLNLTHATVRSHVQSLLCKLGVHSRAGAVSVAVRSGLIRRCA
jgi:DNA-binding NarL/FixJ family response regulator